MKSKIKKINNLLIKHFGVRRSAKKLPDPVDLLIATILSQNTNDKNSYKAYKNLKEEFSNWNEVANESRLKIEKLIKIAGLGKQKSTAIKNFLQIVSKKYGKVTLAHLKQKTDAEIIEELTNFTGIGVKTASCVLLFAMNRNVCPVDTHVHRTLNRIGLVKTASPDKTFYAINKNLPDCVAHSFHTNLIILGRGICKSSKPNCTICPLLKICSFKQKNLDNNSNYKSNQFMLLDEV